MNIKAYIGSLDKLNLTLEELTRNGRSIELAEEYVSTFSLPLKSDSSDENEPSPILRIIENCDTRHFNIFRFRFTEINDIGPYILFGEKDSNYLGIHKETQEIHHILYPYVMEYEMGESEEIEDTMPASIGQQEYLEAVYHTAELLQKVLKEEFTLNDTEIVEKYVDRCTSIAGGTKYFDFWNMFINS